MSVLAVRDLKKAYTSPDGETTPVIDIESYEMAAGEQVALEGESGSGKTTFLHLIAGILKADSGSIVVAGDEMTAMREAQRDRARALHLGYVFQTFNLLDGYSALENVLLGMMFGPGTDRARAESLLERVGLSDRMHYKPRQLSVGQQQRVAVARALANGPRLVLGDEPTGNLDRVRAAESLALIREVCDENGAALLLVSHDRHVLEAFDRCDRLAELNRTEATR
ncbi:MAG: ABC transporter ATP-binding protein [Planctomycetota bacterium]|jgi:putative ABC transport system ATP-binding protein